MLPRWHILYGALFTLILWVAAPNIGWINLLLVFLASFLIDFDHYMAGARKIGTLNLSKVLNYHTLMMRVEKQEQGKGIYRKGDFHIFHTIEFHLLIALLGIFFEPFFYIFIGMVFHSLLDVYSLLTAGRMYRREYFFFNWLGNQF